MGISIERPYMALLIPVILAVILIMSHFLQLNNKNKKIKYIVIRCLVAVSLILALCDISIHKKDSLTTTIFLVDLSDSMSNHRDEIKEYLGKVTQELPKKNQVGIVAFGADTVVEQFVTDSDIVTTYQTMPVVTATNIENAVNTAMAMLPESGAKRLVLISDGEENSGNMLNSAATLAAQKINVDVIKLEHIQGKEVYVDDLKVPDSIRVGDKYAVTVTIVSNVDTDATVNLYSGKELKASKSVRLSVGSNQYVFYDTATENGYRNYKVSVLANEDTLTINNEYSAYTQVETAARVLVVEGKPGEAEQLGKVFDAANVQYTVVTPQGVPVNMTQLLAYNSVVFVNVYADDLKKGFSDNIESYVKDYAGGFIAIGGEDSFALGGYRNTVFEKILPVKMDPEGEHSVPKMEMIMVIDHSGSMSVAPNQSAGYSSLTLAKEAAKKAVTNLRDTDNVGVLVFDDTFTWVVKPQLVSDRTAIENSIESIEEGGGTSIYPALEEAAKQISKSDAQIKHIILLTDGEDYYENYSKVISDINDNGITLSTVSIGSESNTRLLENLSQECGGRYYYTDSSSEIPRIFAQEIFLSAKSYIVNEEFTPVVAAGNSLSDVFSSGIPTLLGYIATSSKQTATNVLVSHKKEPVLTVWQYGLGKTVAFTTDAAGKWSGNWAKWEGYTQFYKNLVDYTVAKAEDTTDTVNVRREGNNAVITYSTENYSGSTKVSALCTDNEGESTEITLLPVRPGVYEGTADVSKTGVYNISVRNENGGEIAGHINTAMAMQYSDEYKFNNDVDTIQRFIELCGGKEKTLSDEIFVPIKNSVKTGKNITIFLLALGLLIYILDILERRLDLDIIGPAINKFKNKASQNSNEKETLVNLPKQEETIIKEEIQEPKAVKKAKRTDRKKEEKAQETKLDTSTLLKKQQERKNLR